MGKNKQADAAIESPEPLEFLSGGGEMGERMRSLDWSSTPLGSPKSWPQSLKTIVRVLLDSRYAMWMLWGPEFTFFCNDAYLPTVGLKRDWVLGARSDKVWEEIWPDIGPRIQQVLEHGQATWDEGLLLFLERSGFPEETYHTFSYSPVYDDQSRIAGMLCVVTEVTERVIGERRLRVLRDLAARIAGVESVQEGCDRLMSVLADDPLDVPFAALYVLDRQQDRAWLAAHHGPLPESLRPAQLAPDSSSPWPLASAIGKEETQIVGLGAECRIAAPLWPEDSVTRAMVLPVQGQGSSSCVAVLVAGLSPRRVLDDSYRGFFDLVAKQFAAAIADAQAYESERRRAEALAEIDRAKTTFFSNVSHEFRTPLTLMLGPVAEAAGNPLTPEPVRVQLQLAHRNSLRLLKLVNSLLDFSRLEAGRVQASYEPTDLASLTRDLASTFRSALERAGLHFEVDCPPLDEPVHVDREMWEKIVLNLLSNAFKFTFVGTICVRVRRDGAHALLEITDTGVGIPAHELPRLFERFYRVEGMQGRTQEGSGIGLALVQELVKLHGGMITITSTVGRGTALNVRLPFGSGHLPAERIKAARQLSSTAVGAQAYVQEALRWMPEDTLANGSELPAVAHANPGVLDQRFAATFGARILLADDNADMRQYLRALLAPVYVVEAVGDGEQALVAARRERPDLVLTDVMMPRMDGFALLMELRATESLREVPVIMLSARAGEESRVEGLTAGADDYLVKPFSAQELMARVGALLELTRMRRESEERLQGLVQELRERSAELVAVLETVPAAVWIARDRECRVITGNRFAHQVLRMPEGTNLAKSVTGSERPMHYRVLDAAGRELSPEELAVQAAAFGGKPRRGIRENLLFADGSRCALFGNSEPLRGADGAVIGAVSAFVDISELEEAQKQLRIESQRKDEFLATLAHELRNPMAPIRYAAATLRPGVSAATLERARETIERQAGHMARLLDDLLDVSRITRNVIKLNKQTFDLRNSLEEALALARPALEAQQHRLTVSTTPNALWVHADAERILQIIGNLLSNAIKYTDRGGEIQVNLAQAGEQVVIRVTDTGIGFSAAMRPKLFELFSQINPESKAAKSGLGIGLAVVKQLVSLHGGRIEAESPGIDRGATFTVYLPGVEAPTKVETGAAARVVTLFEPNLDVLVIEDNVDAAESLATLLRAHGVATHVAHSGAGALQLAQSLRPRVVLLDIGLPDVSGLDVARDLRRQHWAADTAIIAISGWTQDADRLRSAEAGVDVHLAKPVDPARLLQAIKQLTEKSAAGRPGRRTTS